MDLELPELEIKDPASLEQEASYDDIEADLEEAEEDDQPFIKNQVEMVKQPTAELMRKMAKEQEEVPPPPKKKRELSQKQLDHLAKCREKAAEKRDAKKKAKQEALAAVNEQHKAKAYKPQQHRKAQIKKEKAQYEKATIKVDNEVKQKKTVQETTPEDFNVSHKEEIRKAQQAIVEAEQQAFLKFMGNMERYKQLKTGYKEMKSKSSPAPSAPKESIPKVAKVAPVSQPPIQLSVKQNINDNPYSSFFG